MGVRDTPLITILRWVEWDYGKAGWHGDENVVPVLYTLHYRSNKRRAIGARRLPVMRTTWEQGVTITLMALRNIVERLGTASFVTFDDPLWCGLAVAAEVWAVEEGPGWLDVAPSDNPLRHTARVVYGVLAEDLAVIAITRDQRDDLVRADTTSVSGDLGHALTLAASTVDYQRELDAEARRTGAPAP